MKSYDEWKKCVIQIACKNEKNEEKRTGTAIILSNNGYYLITAKHIIIDKITSRAYTRIIRVPSFEEELSEDSKIIAYVDKNSNVIKSPSKPPGEYCEEKTILPGVLMCLDAGTTDSLPYSLDKNFDIAVISLKRYPRFIEDLLKNGYHAVLLDDIANEPTSIGADIFCIGYPDMSQIRDIAQSQAISNWSSDHRTLPLFSFGKVALLNKDLDYFWGDVRVYFGNSGGPVIEDNKLVGIVVGLGTEEMDDELLRVPFAKAIKAKYIKNLLSEHDNKIKYSERSHIG